MTPQWYALCVMGGCEVELAARLRLQGYRAEAPTEIIRVRLGKHRRIAERKVPLLSGYVLVQAPADRLMVVISERDAIQWVCMDGKPVSIKDQIVERFLSDPFRRTATPVRRALRVGMDVEIATGLLAGQTGRLARIRKRRAIVTIRAGREQRDVDVPVACVEAA